MAESNNMDPDVGRCGYAQFEPLGNGPITPEEALEGINKIRNSIVGLQTINWSEHIYPLVSLLERAGIEGGGYPQNKANYGTCLAQRNEAIELLKASPCMKGRSDWRIEAEVFLKRIGEDAPTPHVPNEES